MKKNRQKINRKNENSQNIYISPKNLPSVTWKGGEGKMRNENVDNLKNIYIYRGEYEHTFNKLKLFQRKEIEF